eukprot:scaffold170124_cov32-Tisochrysis_lutea.AAC.1
MREVKGEAERRERRRGKIPEGRTTERVEERRVWWWEGTPWGEGSTSPKEGKEGRRTRSRRRVDGERIVKEESSPRREREESYFWIEGGTHRNAARRRKKHAENKRKEWEGEGERAERE